MRLRRVVHYINQFYAGMGGEEAAGTPPGTKSGAVGPGIYLGQVLAPAAEVVATVFCGDNYIGERGEEAANEVARLIAEAQPDLVITGPAFASGRYGLACGQVAKAVRATLQVPVIGGLHESSPALELYRNCMFAVPTGDTAVQMRASLDKMAHLANRLLSQGHLGPASVEGYFPTGRRVNELRSERGARRARNMLLRRLTDEPFQTEWELPRYEPVTPAAPVTDLAQARVALVSEAGCVPAGNPDGILSSWAETWATYPLQGVNDLRGGEWQFIHGGFDITFVDDDPDRMVPLDALREIEAEGRIGQIHPEFLSICGSMAPISTAVRCGREVASALRRAQVSAAILTAT